MKDFNKPNMEGENSYKVMTAILNKDKVPSWEQIDKLNSFFMCRWLSNNPYTTPIAATINRYYNMPIRAQYLFMSDYSELTGMENKVKFIGFVKDQTPKELEQLLENIKKYYKVNDETAMEYFKVMDNPTRDKLMDMYKEGLVKQK